MKSPFDKLIRRYPVLQQNRTALMIIINLVFIYISWKIFMLVVGQERILIEERVWPWFSQQWEYFNQWLRELYLEASAWLLTVLGNPGSITGEGRPYAVGGEGIGRVSLGNYCLGVQLFWFIGAIIALSKGIWWRKILFIASGIFIIFSFNVWRIVGLCYAIHHYPGKFNFNHDYVFNFAMYAIIFLMIWLWNKYFSGVPKEGEAPE